MDLTEDHVRALDVVRKGADIFSYTTAKLLRQCNKEGFVEICRAHGDYPGQAQQPYFGAITTAKGKRIIREFHAKKLVSQDM